MSTDIAVFDLMGTPNEPKAKAEAMAANQPHGSQGILVVSLSEQRARDVW